MSPKELAEKYFGSRTHHDNGDSVFIINDQNHSELCRVEVERAEPPLLFTQAWENVELIVKTMNSICRNK